MATKLPTDAAEVSAQPDWGIELSKNEWELEGIDLEDEKTMRDIYEGLGFQEDDKVHRKRRTGLRAYIERAQDDKKREYAELDTLVMQKLTKYDPSEFNSPCQTILPVVYEKGDEIQPFLAPNNWLEDTAKTVLEQANLEEMNNPCMSPVALVWCSHGGK